MRDVPKSWLLLATLAGSGLGLVAARWYASDADSPLMATARSAEAHELSRLRVLHEAIAPVFETYVEPERLNAEAMFRAALDAVELRVPSALFEREGARLAVTLGGYRTMMDVPVVSDARSLEHELRRVAMLLETHLVPSDIVRGDLDLDPFAALEFAMAHGMLAVLDPHSAVLPPEASREMDQENQGQFGGLGIDIDLADDRLLVGETLPDSPAARAGLRAGDHIRRIDGQSTINLTLDEAIRLLRGGIGAPVTLEVVHEGAGSAEDIVVVRGQIPIHPIQGWALPGAVAYVRIPGFHATTYTDLVDTLTRLRREEGDLRGVVLDLRDNPGGYLREAIAVVDAFVNEGEIVSTRGPHDRRPHVEVARTLGTLPESPMVVLVSASSASASEIVAGALQANQRAVIVGDRTFGKGSVQNLHALPLDGKLKVTIAHYLTPGERSIQGVGVSADIQLTPQWVGRSVVGEAPKISLFPGVHTQREADLDGYLQRPEGRGDDGAAYSLVYLRDPDAELPSTRLAPDLGADTELHFAHALVLGTTSARRGDMLAAAAPLVERLRVQEDAAIGTALSAYGLDWTPGPTPEIAAVALSVKIGGGTLVAGERAAVTVEVANTGLQPLHQVVALGEGHPLLDGLEFPIGRLAPGEARAWTRWVDVDTSEPSGIEGWALRARDGEGAPLATERVEVETVGTLPARLAWQWKVVEPGGNGRIDPGELVRIEVEVQNVGDGPAFGATARLRNRSGKAVDLVTGTARAGTMVDDRGRACRVLQPGWEAGAAVGDERRDPERVAARLAPEWEEGCSRRLEAGATWTGAFEVRFDEVLLDGYPMEITLEDHDLGLWGRDGDDPRISYVRQREALRLRLGPVPPPSVRREMPKIELSVAPGGRVMTEHATLSGRVTDADGVAHLAVWLDDTKVAVETAPSDAGVPALPFTADLRLTPGTHHITVLARDLQGQGTELHRVVRRAGESYQAGVDPH